MNHHGAASACFYWRDGTEQTEGLGANQCAVSMAQHAGTARAHAVTLQIIQRGFLRRGAASILAATSAWQGGMSHTLRATSSLTPPSPMEGQRAFAALLGSAGRTPRRNSSR